MYSSFMAIISMSVKYFTKFVYQEHISIHFPDDMAWYKLCFISYEKSSFSFLFLSCVFNMTLLFPRIQPRRTSLLTQVPLSSGRRLPWSCLAWNQSDSPRTKRQWSCWSHCLLHCFQSQSCQIFTLFFFLSVCHRTGRSLEGV